MLQVSGVHSSTRRRNSRSRRSTRSSCGECENIYYVQGELANQKPELRPPRTGNSFNVFCSIHNPGAKQLMHELSSLMAIEFCASEVSAQQLAKHTPRQKTSSWRQLHVTSDPANLAKCDHFLVYLTDETWTRGDEATAPFTAAVARAVNEGVHLLLAHEMPGLGQDRRCPCEFGTFFANSRGTTPQELLQMNIYGQIAIALRGEVWRQASMVMLSKAIAAADDGQSAHDDAETVRERKQRWAKHAILHLKTPGIIFQTCRLRVL